MVGRQTHDLMKSTNELARVRQELMRTEHMIIDGEITSPASSIAHAHNLPIDTSTQNQIQLWWKRSTKQWRCCSQTENATVTELGME
jgi:hypothetical protein